MTIEQKHKVFISYHHANDQTYKEKLLEMSMLHNIFIDKSVNTEDIDDSLSSESIRTKIRDEYLIDSTVTIVLVGLETKHRKHIDWELYSSMYDGVINKKSGILVINLPSTSSNNVNAGHGEEEKKIIHSNITNWTSSNRIEYNRKYPYMPERIIDSLLLNKGKISVVSWNLIENSPETLRILIDFTNKDRKNSEYDLSRPMKRRNS